MIIQYYIVYFLSYCPSLGNWKAPQVGSNVLSKCPQPFKNISLCSGTTRCCMLILYFLSSIPPLSSPRNPISLSWRMVFRNQDLNAICFIATGVPLLVGPLPTERGKWMMGTNPHAQLGLKLSLSVSSSWFADSNPTSWVHSGAHPHLRPASHTERSSTMHSFTCSIPGHKK